MNLKKVINLLQKISPRLTAKIAFHFISKPKGKKIRAFEKSILEIATKDIIRFNKFNIQTYKWGNGTKKAILVHGWGGRASNFGAIIPELIKNGYTVISFDGPCHGESTKKKTSFFEMSDVVKLFLKKDEYDLIITHSMGTVLTFTAMNSIKYKVNQMIVLTSPSKFLEFIDLAVTQFGLTTKTTSLLINKIRKTTTEYDPISLDAESVLKNIEIKNITFIHDKFDKVIPIEKTKNVSSFIKNSKFIEIEGTGHFKMLWSKKVVKIIEELILR
jgi:predicted esterase